MSTQTIEVPTESVAEASVLAVLATGERPARPGPLSASLTHGWRALLKIKHVPEQLFDVTMFPVMMLLMFTYLFGGALAGSVSEYVQSFVPGILVSTVIMITMYTGVGLNNDMAKGVFGPVPLAALVASGGDGRRPAGRRRPLHHRLHRHPHARASSSASGPTAACSACSAAWPSCSSSPSASRGCGPSWA